MKVIVKIDDRSFEVDVINLHTQPVIAVVDGESFEVWPKDLITTPAVGPVSVPAVNTPAPQAGSSSSPVPEASHEIKNEKTVYAPIPGVIVSIAVHPGDAVEVGQELCILEAMKMKNSIRSPRAGEIAAVHVAVGDHVKHHDVLFEYTH